METKEKKWEGKTGGGQFGQKFLLHFLKHVHVRFLYPILYLVIPFYLIFASKGRNAAYHYFRERQHFSVLKSAWCTFRNHIIFGEVVLDKFALLAGNKKQFNIDIDTDEVIHHQMKQEKGFIIASAHVGNLELAGLCIPHTEKKINTIIFGGERADFQKKRDKAFDEVNINLIPVKQDMSHLFIIKEALDNGEIVVIPCDRIFGSTKNTICQLLGEEAELPIGPFRLAAQLEVPMYTLFIMKEGNTHYKTYESRIPAHDELPNSTQKAIAMASDYTKLLEKIIIKYPTQWFNFFPYWKESNKGTI